MNASPPPPPPHPFFLKHLPITAWEGAIYRPRCTLQVKIKCEFSTTILSSSELAITDKLTEGGLRNITPKKVREIPQNTGNS